MKIILIDKTCTFHELWLNTGGNQFHANASLTEQSRCRERGARAIISRRYGSTNDHRDSLKFVQEVARFVASRFFGGQKVARGVWKVANKLATLPRTQEVSDLTVWLLKVGHVTGALWEVCEFIVRALQLHTQEPLCVISHSQCNFNHLIRFINNFLRIKLYLFIYLIISIIMRFWGKSNIVCLHVCPIVQ